jgi:hypothetical protein
MTANEICAREPKQCAESPIATAGHASIQTPLGLLGRDRQQWSCLDRPPKGMNHQIAALRRKETACKRPMNTYRAQFSVRERIHRRPYAPPRRSPFEILPWLSRQASILLSISFLCRYPVPFSGSLYHHVLALHRPRIRPEEFVTSLFQGC